MVKIDQKVVKNWPKIRQKYLFPTHSIEWISHGNGNSSNGLSNGKLSREIWLVNHFFGGVISTEINGSVNNDALHRADKSRIKSTNEAVGFVTFANTVKKAFKFAISSGFAHISTCKIFYFYYSNALKMLPFLKQD